MSIQRERHYIDRQADHEAVLPSSLKGPIIVQVLTTMGKTRLHTTCHFYSAVVIKAYLTIPIAFVFYQSRSLARDWLNFQNYKQARPIALLRDR